MSGQPTEIQNHLAAVQDHARQFAEFTFVYPVISRRSRGLSIGINLNPDKVCNFDCIYCEVDRSTPGKASRVDVDQMRRELAALVGFVKDGSLAKVPKFSEAPWLAHDIKDLAFSGEGEPTLVHNFAECVEAVADVKHAEGLAAAKLILITDAAGLNKATVKRGLEIMDANQGEVWAKLDAGTESYFRRINRTTVRFDRILANLLETARVRPIVIQSLFLKVRSEPMPPDELTAYCQRLNELTRAGAQIKELHVYTIARPTAEGDLTRLTGEELERVGAAIRSATSLPVFTFA